MAPDDPDLFVFRSEKHFIWHIGKFAYTKNFYIYNNSFPHFSDTHLKIEERYQRENYECPVCLHLQSALNFPLPIVKVYKIDALEQHLRLHKQQEYIGIINRRPAFPISQKLI